MSKEVNTVALDLIKESKDVIRLAKSLKNDGFSIAILKELAQEVTVIVEKYNESVGVLSPKVKVGLAVTIINTVVDIPYVPEWIEKKIFTYVANKAVKYLTDKFGDDWLAKKEAK